MQITIKNPNNLPTIDIRSVIPLQENLKDLDTEAHDKLLNNILTRGFDIPIMVWQKTGADDVFMLDGHQRQRVMELNELHDNGSHEVPRLLVEAPDHRTAVERLLEIASQFGEVTVPGLDELAELYKLDTDSMNIRFDVVDLDKLWGQPEEPAADKDKEPKGRSWTMDELRQRRHDFTVAGNDDGGFVDWLEQN